MYHRVLNTLLVQVIKTQLVIGSNNLTATESHSHMTTKWMNTCTKSVIKTLQQRPLSSLDKVFMTFFETLQWLVFYCVYYLL